MKDKYVILRHPQYKHHLVIPECNINVKSNSSSNSISLNESQQSLISPISIEIEELDSRDISNLNRQTDTVAIAPFVPMKLIKPVDMVNATHSSLTSAGKTWGIQAIGADTSPFTGNGVTVAVLDTGIDSSHIAFSGLNIIQKDFTGEGDGDQNGHGTHCAGTIFGRNVEETRIGVAPGVQKALIGKVLGCQGGGSSEQLIKAIEWATENGANIISMSLGMDFAGFAEKLQDKNGFPPALAASHAMSAYRQNVRLFEKLISFIHAQGDFFKKPIIIIAAAGNESKRDKDSHFEIEVGPPAVVEGIISVAALGQGKNGYIVAPFSNIGAKLSGPGVGVNSAKAGGGLIELSGTSMAAPHVAGVAALWAEHGFKKNAITSEQLTAWITTSANTNKCDNNLHPLDIGAGLIHAPQA